MPKQLINLGTTPNDRSGDTLRDAGSKMNSNVNELYNTLGDGTNLQVSVTGATTGQVLKFNGTSFVPQTDLNTDAVTSVNTQTGAVVLDTDDVQEPVGATNQYFTAARARAAISASGALSYDNITGALTFTQGNTDTVAEGTNNLYFTAGRFDFRFSQKTTDDLAEGSIRKYFSESLVRSSISATQNISYNSATGVFTGPALATVATTGSYNDLTDKPALGATTQWTVDSSGTAINITGNGFLGTEDNPTIYVYRGMRYQFANEAGATVEFVDATDEGVRTVTVTDGGSYASAPAVSFTGGTGSGATGTAVLSTTGSVFSIAVTDGGAGYTIAPTISFTNGGGTGATATATVVGGAVTLITVDTGGSGYTTAPTVVITADPSDTITATATATATIQFPVQSVTITNPGTYTVAPSVSFASGTATATATIDLKLVPANQDFTAATAANNASTVLCPLMSTATGTQWKYRLVGDESVQVGDIVVV